MEQPPTNDKIVLHRYLLGRAVSEHEAPADVGVRADASVGAGSRVALEVAPHAKLSGGLEVDAQCWPHGVHLSRPMVINHAIFPDLDIPGPVTDPRPDDERAAGNEFHGDIRLVSSVLPLELLLALVGTGGAVGTAEFRQAIDVESRMAVVEVQIPPIREFNAKALVDNVIRFGQLSTAVIGNCIGLTHTSKSVRFSRGRVAVPWALWQSVHFMRPSGTR